ncbi:MAG: hypothetical protein KDB23_15925, partial [Planctomycetales bacterium]|nr:hypothetical protein [Planctomycetales bacterium]
IVGAGTGFIAFLMACIISLTTISIGWIVYRPLLGISLLAAAIACIVLLVKRLRQNKAVPATVVTPPPVPTPPPLP